MKVGDVVCVLSTHICNAPVGLIGEEGVVVEVLDGDVGGIIYRGKLRVVFERVLGGYRDWLFDESELDCTGLV